MTTEKEVTCPFCSLLCDDLSVRTSRQKLVVSDNACHIGKQGFSTPDPPAHPRIKDRRASLEEAVTRAASILRKSRYPLIAGLGTDVSGQQAAIRLAECSGARLRHMHEDVTLRYLKTLQTGGWVTTTLAEVKNRADVIIFIGDGVTTAYPRFIERCINNRYAHTGLDTSSRRIAYIGTPHSTEKKQLGRKTVVTAGDGMSIADDLAILKSKLQDITLDYPGISAARNRKLDSVAAMVTSAGYGVFVCSPAALPPENADLIIDSMTDLVRNLNDKQRFAGLLLSGSNGGTSSLNVSTWQTGHPVAVDFSAGYPQARPEPGNTWPADMDALLWVSSFHRDAVPGPAVPRIVLSSTAPAETDCEVFIPVGVPGIDHGGNLFRTDSIVTLPLKQLRQTGHPSSAGVLQQITNVLAGERS